MGPGVIEFVGGLLLTIGLFTRLVAFVLAGVMAVAYFMDHATRNIFPLLNGGEAEILYCLVFLLFFVAGPGPWSIDKSSR
jgi:putative oxidoreductase